MLSVPARVGLELKRARVLESSLLTGFIMISVPLSGGTGGGLTARGSGLLLVASVLLFASIYAFNSYFGFIADRLNPRLKERQYETGAEYALRGWACLVLCIPIFFALEPKLVPLALAIAALWGAYSIPGGAKARPVWGTALHFFAQILQFHLGIVAVGAPSARSLAVSVFFALLFSSGHLMHELKDYASDREAGIRTNAVVFGPARIVGVYRGATVLICAYWLAVFWFGLVSAHAFAPFFLAALAHAFAALATSRRALEERQGNQRFQVMYRLFYLLAGCVVILIGA